MNDNDRIQATRQIVEGVLDRARNDGDYKDALLGDPERVLRDAGVDEDLAAYVVDEEIEQHDVTGHRVSECRRYTYARGCDTITCLISLCGDIPYTNYAM